MPKIRVTNLMPKFVKSNTAACDRVLGRMAVDIERFSKSMVPHDKGHLLQSGRHRKTGRLKYRVEYNKEYARFQEFGGDSKRKVLKYSKPGKKAHYLSRAGNKIAEKANNYIKNELSIVKP